MLLCSPDLQGQLLPLMRRIALGERAGSFSSAGSAPGVLTPAPSHLLVEGGAAAGALHVGVGATWLKLPTHLLARSSVAQQGQGQE